LTNQPVLTLFKKLKKIQLIMKTKNLIKFLTLGLGMLFVMSCEEDSSLIKKENVTDLINPINFKIASADHLFTKNKSLKKTIGKIKTNMQKSTTSSSYNFGIYESRVQVLELNDYTQYTFEVYRDSLLTNQLENYVLRIYEDESIDQYLVKYDLQSDGSYGFNSIQNINDPDLNIAKTFGCTPSLIDTYEEESCVGIVCTVPGHETGGGDCECATNNTECPIIYFECETTTVFVYDDNCEGGDDGNTNGPDGPPIGGGQDSNDNTNDTNNNTYTKNFEILSECSKEAISNLPQNLQDWINGLDDCDPTSIGGTTSCNRDLYEDIAGFINSNTENCELTEEDEDFLNAVKDALEDDPDVEVDWEDKLFIDPSFNNNQKAKCVYNKIKNINGSVFKNLLSNFDNSKNALLRLRIDNIPQNSSGLPERARTRPRASGSNLRSFEIVLDQDFVSHASLIEIALALIHEMIHAEIMERCVRLGIISALNYNNNWETLVTFSNETILSTSISDVLFAHMISTYSNYQGPASGSSSNWQHELFNVADYRESIANNLSDIHLFLDDLSNPFENNLNNGQIIPLTFEEYFDLISWGGLQGTTEYNNLSNLEKAKINQAFSQTSAFYNNNCN